jgi:nucleotide-binding universal stress UspA family protein
MPVQDNEIIYSTIWHCSGIISSGKLPDVLVHRIRLNLVKKAPKGNYMKQINNILFPLDLDSDFDALLPLVQSFAAQFNATVYLLFVVQDLPPFVNFYVPHCDIENFQGKVQVAAKEKMAAAVKEFFKGFQKLETKVEFGNPAKIILEFAKKEQIDLIIMGTQGRKGVERAIFGSVALKVVQSAPCPVVTIRP